MVAIVVLRVMSWTWLGVGVDRLILVEFEWVLLVIIVIVFERFAFNIEFRDEVVTFTMFAMGLSVL